MVLDSERGCTREAQSCGPETTDVSFALECEQFLWSDAFDQPRHAPLQSDLEKIYADRLNGRKIIEHLPLKDDGSDLPGMTIFSMARNEPVEEFSIAYRCGSCRVIYAGRPNIHESSERFGHIDFDCGMCKRTMYSLEVEPNFRD